MLIGAVGLLFLIVCANLASLQLGRGVGRTRELAIRRALGAGRARVLRQLLTESLVLSVAGGTLGFALAAFARVALTRYAASAIPLFAVVETDRTVLFFALGLSLLAPIIFDMVPALSTSRSEQVTERGESTSRETRWLRHLLVGGEVALSIVLIVGAVLLRSLGRLQDVDSGFAREHAISFTITLPAARYPDSAARYRGFVEIERRLREQTGVEAFGATSTLALRGFTNGVLAYFVSQRSRELGIRLALGAKPAALFRMVVGQGMRPVAIGAGIGLAGAAGISTLMQSLLFGVAPVDPAAYGVATAILAAIAAAACAVPALRATRVDPLVALRDE